MAGKISTKTFKGGMNKDVSLSILPEDQYTHAENYKLIANEDDNSLVLENSEGNSLWLDLDLDVGLNNSYYLIGHCYIQPYLVLFYTNNTTDKTPTAGNSAIVRLTIDKDELQETEVIYQDSALLGYLTFSDTYPIKAVGYYEAEDNIKVYWTDGYNPVRWMNIMANMTSYSSDMFDLTPDFPIDTGVNSRPQFNSLVSGNLNACTVQYAYQYYIDKGASTVYSPASEMILVPEVNTPYVPATHKGGLVDENTAYGVSFDIEIPSTNLFDRMRVVAIQYNTYNAVPTIRIITEIDINVATNYTLNFVDSGSLISELTYEEFSIQSNTILYAKDLSIKDNRLFLANIREDSFDVDFDARVYRFNTAGTGALIYDDTTYTSSQTVTTADWSSVDVDHNVVVRYNDPDYEHNSTYNAYIYNADGAGSDNLGAEGPAMKIQFITDNELLDVYTTGSAFNDNTIWSGNIDTQGNKSFQRQEVYRLGIVFRNAKFQKSPVKWMGDIKMPEHFNDDAYGPYYHLYNDAVSGYPMIQKLGLVVNMKAGYMPPNATSWEVVYVPRESKDRSVLAQGLYMPGVLIGSNNWYTSYNILTQDKFNSGAPDYSNLSGRFVSPEINFNKNLEYSSGDYLYYLGFLDWSVSNLTNYKSLYSMYHHKHYSFTPATNTYNKLALTGSSIFNFSTDISNEIIVGSETWRGYSDAATVMGNAGTCLICTHDAWDTASGNWTPETSATVTNDRIALVNYRRNVFESQYGGITYQARGYNNYVSISDLVYTDTAGIPTYEGDTFINYHQHMALLYNLNGSRADTIGSSWIFPAESSIYAPLRYDETYYRHVNSKPYSLLQEVSGTHGENTVGQGGAGTAHTLVQDLPLYQYNSVYSQTNRSSLIPADNDNFEATENYPTRILNSEIKTNNETEDSFLKFLPNNFIDVDGKHGPINNLESFMNQLFFWQTSGFGVASVNTRSLIQDNNPGILALGTGGVLERYDYLSESIGNQNIFGIAKSRKSLYWVDNNKNEIVKFDRGINSVSKLKGVQTWINEQGRIGDVKTVYDHKYNDVIFTITFARKLNVKTVSGSLVTQWDTMLPELTASIGVEYNCILNGRYVSTENGIGYRNYIDYTGGGDWSTGVYPNGDVGETFYVTIDHDSERTYTLTFNEQVNAFTSYNSFTPGRYLELDTSYLSTNDYHDLWKHNDDSASRATYYGTTYDSILTVPFTQEYAYTKVFDSLKWDSKSVDSNDINQFVDTFQNVEMYNEYQNTGNRTLVYDTTPTVGQTEIGRRERTWSMTIPRNIVNADVSTNPNIHDVTNHDETQTFKQRIRDKYLTCKFTYDNGDGNTFSIPFISTIYRRSIR